MTGQVTANTEYLENAVKLGQTDTHLYANTSGRTDIETGKGIWPPFDLFDRR
jgi:hypothetical protein